MQRIATSFVIPHYTTILCISVSFAELTTITLSLHLNQYQTLGLCNNPSVAPADLIQQKEMDGFPYLGGVNLGGGQLEEAFESNSTI